MRKFAAMGIAVVFLAATALSQAQDVPEFPSPEKEHQWLQQLVGEWEAESEMFMEPGKPPVESTGTESVRTLGGFWIVAENKSQVFGQPFTGVLTLGYDTQNKHYVGTWTDSMTSYLWTYHGKLDESGKVLTLHTEGPCPMKPGELSQFRETLEIKSKDHKVYTSFLQEEDGKWTTIMRTNYRRKK